MFAHKNEVQGHLPIRGMAQQISWYYVTVDPNYLSKRYQIFRAPNNQPEAVACKL